MPAILITPPSSEPVTLDELKAHLRFESDAEDTLFARLIAAARLHVEAHTRRVLMTQGWRATLDRWPVRRRVLLPVAPVSAVTAVRVRDSAGQASLVSPSSYTIDISRTPAALILQSAILAPTAEVNGIEIDMTCGYGAADAVPSPLREAVLRLAALWFENRIEAERFSTGLRSSTVEALLAPYRVVWP